MAITRESRGRRIDWARPSASLLLRKPTMALSHGGGQRFARDSWEYRVLERWIAAGKPHVPGSGSVERVAIEPSRRILRDPVQTESLRVMVTFADGKSEDMTSYCEFRSQDESIVGVASDGTIRAVSPGDSAVIAVYRGQPASARVFVPRADTAPLLPATSDDQHEVNLVDRHVLAKLRELSVQPSVPTKDEEFLRRVTLATTGQLPSPEQRAGRRRRREHPRG